MKYVAEWAGKLNTPWAVIFAGGILFVIAFYCAYGLIDSIYYAVRDDGVITMSHAKNLVDYGFIGVGPSGERVEGYSAPLQFFVYALLYLVFGIGYAAYANLQTLLCTFLLGGIFTAFFVDRKVFALSAAFFSAVLLAFQTSFVQWHGSGMENAITHVMFMATLLTLFLFAQRKIIDYRLVAIPFLASISRVESVFHIFPLVFVFAVYWALFEKDKRGFKLLAYFMLCWLVFQLWRYFYFGELLPNTAHAQSISVGDRIKSLLTLDKNFLDGAAGTAKHSFSSHGGFYLFLIAPFLVFVEWSKPRALLCVLFIAAILTTWFHAYFFGSARLDSTRTTTQLAVYIPSLIVLFFYGVKPRSVLWLSILLIPFVAILFRANYIPPYGMCCDVDRFNGYREEFVKAAEKNQITRPTVANPDLGAMSWHKQFNIVDLGMLGSQIMAKLKGGPLLGEYFYEFAAPDLIETHEWWSCEHWDAIFNDPRFKERYTPIRNRWRRWDGGCQESMLPVGVWIRKDIKKGSLSAERTLLDSLREDLAIAPVEAALNSCIASGSNASGLSRCAYVARSVFRQLPEFRSRDESEHLAELFQASPSAGFDEFLVQGYLGGRRDEGAMALILEHFIAKYELTPVANDGPFEIFMSDKYIVYKNDHCSKADVKDPFYLHAMVKNQSGFVGLDFNFSDQGFIAGDLCGAARALPDKPLESIKTGQWMPAETRSLWEMRVTFPL